MALPQAEDLPRSADVVIIGGGITGCAAAYYLAKEKAKVALVERGEVASEQSSRAWGFVRQQGRHPAEVPMAALASRLWENLAGELQADLEFVREGILAPAETEGDETRFRKAAETAARHGLGTRFLDAEEMRRIIPEIAGVWRGALFTPEDGHAEPRKATEAFAAAAARRGASIHARQGAVALERTKGSIAAVRTAAGTISAGAVLCAAGVGTAAIARSLDITLPIHPLRVSVAETKPTDLITRTAVWAPLVAFRPTLRNTFYVGGGYRGRVGDLDLTIDAVRHARLFLPQFRANRQSIKLHLGSAFLQSFRRGIAAWPSAAPKPNPATVAYNMGRFYDLLPRLRGLEIMRVWAGRLDVTPDMIPVIGRVPEIANLVFAAGYSGHGFALGPASGQILADLLLTGRTGIDLRPFRPTRFAEGDFDASPEAF